MKIFVELEANTLELMEETQLSLSMVEALDSYIEESLEAEDNKVEDSIMKIFEAGHGDALEKVRETFFIRSDPKKRLVWLYGHRNTGKTTLVRYLEKIFSAQKFNFKGAYCPIEAKTSN